MSDDDSSSSSSSSSSNDDFLVAKSTSKNTSTSKVDDDDEADNSLQINTKYAKEYESRKRREELTNYRQLKVLEGVSDSDDDDSSDSESEDEDAELLTADMDVKIIKTLRALKQKDEGIYDKNVTFFEEGEDSDDSEGASGKDRVKKMRYKDVVREHILEEIEADEKGSTLKDDGPRKADGRDLAYDVEQREIRKAFLESTKDDNPDGSESEEEDWLKPKAKTVETDEDQAQVRRLWEEEFASSKSTSAGLKLVDPKGEVQDPDKFLMDFISNRKWVDTTDTALRKLREVDEESVESFQDKMDDFESKYNFRFEEAAASSAGNEESGASHSIVHYARGSVGDNVLRRKDETRRQKRLSRKERKAEERKAKEEQLRRLKNAKREELEERMQQVRNVLGYDVLNDGSEKQHALGAAEEEMILKLMEGEYDPDKFEQVMNAAYGEDYYQQEDDKWKTDQDVKSDLAKGVDDSDIVGGGDMYDEVNEEVDDEDAYPADAGGNEDEVYDDEEAQWEEDQYGDSGMEKKLKSKMMDELYKLDYEDIIGDMPTRFKYRQVEPNSYGLSTTEILMANDTSLKQFVSLKKMAPYRDEGEYQPGTKKRKRFRQMLKSDREEMEKSEQATENNAAVDTEEGNTKKKKRRRQKKGSKKIGGDAADLKIADATHGTADKSGNPADVEEPEKNSKRKKSKVSPLDSSENVEQKANVESSTKDIARVKEKKNIKDKNKHAHTAGKDGKKKRKKSSGVEGVSAARLASYGI